MQTCINCPWWERWYNEERVERAKKHKDELLKNLLREKENNRRNELNDNRFKKMSEWYSQL